MRASVTRLIVWLPLLLFGTVRAQLVPSAAAQRAYDEFNDRIHSELRAIDPAAEALLREADETRARGDHHAAAELYGKVFEKVPTFVHALRRQAGEELAHDDRPAAMQLFEKAVALEKSADNLVALAQAIVRNPSGHATPEELERAGELARQAIKLDPDSYYVAAACAEVALERNELYLLETSVAALERIAPDDYIPHYFGTIAAAARGNLNAAGESLERAHAAGLRDDVYRTMLASLNEARPVGPRLARWGGIIAGIWIAGGLVLFVIGSILSAVTLHASERPPARPEAGATGLDAALRRVYRFVLWGCCAYYYLSMPILLTLILVIGGGLLYGLLAVGHIPIKLIVIVLVITVVTAWAILKSLVVRRKDEDPGVRIDLEREPALRQLLVDVAARVGTRPVDSVYMTPGTEVAVFERGGLLRQIGGRTERCLILGAGALDDLSLGPLRAVLAHEYGHFSNRDTAGGGFALAVRMSVASLAENLARSGAASWYNPAWLFVNGFHRLFLRISQGASRLQEVLADRWAAILYGAQAFEDGLRHVIARSVRFHAHVNATLQEVVEQKRPLANLYRYAPAAPPDEAKIAAEVQAAIDRKPSPYDSHPCPTDRFRWVHALGVRVPPAPDDSAPVWSIFADRQALEQEMTDVVRAAVAANHSIVIKAGG